MKLNRPGPNHCRFLTFYVLLILLSSNSAGQRPQTLPGPTRPTGVEFEWRFSLQQGTTASSNVTVTNVCFKQHRFEVELQNLPFMSLLGPPSFDVKAGVEHKLPVKFDATQLSPGEYSGDVLIKCPTCPKEKGCIQDRQVLKVRMTVATSTGPVQLNAPALIDNDCACESVKISAKATTERVEGKGSKKTRTVFKFLPKVDIIKGKKELQRKQLSLSLPYEAEIKCKKSDAVPIGEDDVCRGKVAIKIVEKGTYWEWEDDKRKKVQVPPDSQKTDPTELPCEQKCSAREAHVITGNIIYTAVFLAEKFPTEGTLELHFDPENSSDCEDLELGWKMIIKFKNGKIDEKNSDYNGDGRLNQFQKDPWSRPSIK